MKRSVRSEPTKRKGEDNELTFDMYLNAVARYRDASFDHRYNLHLLDKRIALVGPSPSLEGSGHGELIDSYDLVVRVNKGYPVTGSISVDIGERTDIHYHCLHESEKCGGRIHYKEMATDGVYLCSPYPEYVMPFHRDTVRVRHHINQQSLDLSYHFISTDLYLTCAQNIGTRPNSGVGAILDLLAHDIRELYVTGFTFFQDGWRKTYKDGNIMERNWKQAQFSGNHFQKPQIQAINELSRDGRLQMDEVMENIVKSI
jgi:hypothetical protein